MNRDFEHLVDVAGLDPAGERRLRRVHELLLAAGPPPQLTAELLEPPLEAAAGHGENVIAFPGRRRPGGVAVVLAATIAAACFGGGYLIASQAHGSSIPTTRVVELQGKGAQSSLASLRVGAVDGNGNLPIELTVNGLPVLKSPKAYYILMLVDDHGKPGALCGMFRVDGGTTSVRFSVPYDITPGTRWVVTAVSPGVHWPGHVVMATS